MTFVDMIWHDRPASEIADALDKVAAAFALPKHAGYPAFTEQISFNGPDFPDGKSLVVTAVNAQVATQVVLHELLGTFPFGSPGMPEAALRSIQAIAKALRDLSSIDDHFIGQPSEPWFLAGAVLAQNYGEPRVIVLPDPWSPVRAECANWDEIPIPDDVRDRFTQNAPKGISISTAPVQGPRISSITIVRLEAFVGDTGQADIDPRRNPATTMRAIQTAVAAGAMLPSVA